MKKRIAYIALGVLALSAGVYVSTRLWAQGPGGQPAPQPVQTRIGVMNLGYVLKSYQKVDAYTAEMKSHFTQFDAAIKEKKTAIEGRTKQAQDPTYTQAQRDACTAEITKLNRELEDMNNSMKKFIGAKTDEQMVTIYKEIQEAAQRYAVAHNLDMVVTYIDAVNPADLLNPMNVMGKMQQRAFMPLYYNPSMDVSVDIAKSLNDAYKAAAATQPAPAPAPVSTPTTGAPR